MNDFLRKKAEMEFNQFVSRNFVRPTECKDPEQIRFYIQELSAKIENLKINEGFVPDSAYALLTQYNTAQNKVVDLAFKSSYC